MAKYVRVDNLDVSDYVTVWDCDCSEYDRQTVMAVDDLQYLPEADVEEVRHGYWKKAVAKKYGNAYCSVCNHFDWNDGRFCSNCGTKMDLKNGGEK